ncbi:exopolysaccharide production protein ExoY [Rhodovulum iodosum]|uniref:Exopolysaccharide production protein ExoY n=1 Tax=Rhodovulum iodosum TaxID=68291 RepID=A0ABV3XR42_9RHOB|nr:sugar transferase [Rhodovulum robiginosum]RSK32798.1 sugar transferase [Rhodovulum robiginosum]
MLFRNDFDTIALVRGIEQNLHLQSSVARQRSQLQKQLFDRAFAALALLFLLPFFVVITLLLLIADGGPVLFSQERIGQHGRPFKCLKFRTMVRDAEARLDELLQADPEARREWQTIRKLTNDPRIHCIGVILRKTSLDELPQFLNVLRGDMSVVGPRPILMEEAVYYGANFKEYMSVKPGVTGAWQVSGRSNTTFEERVAMDVDYVHNRTFWCDLKIIWRTIAVVLKQHGAR